jgi:hypothetical protein
MMPFIAAIPVVGELVKTILDKIWPPAADPNEKLKAEMVLTQMLQERENTLIAAQRDIMVAEMQQLDNYTKRARPTIVYAGLFFIFMVHVAFPLLTWYTKQVLPTLALPEEFWWTWGGVCGVWIIGRTMEKKGLGGAVVSAITGTK